MVKYASIIAKSQSAFISFVERAIGTKSWSLYCQSSHFQALNDAARKGLQHRMARQLLLHAANNVPLWRDRLANQTSILEERLQKDVRQLFNELPITTKADLRAGFPERVTSDGVRDQWRYGSSAGTVDRITVISDFHKRDYLRATNLRLIDAIVGHPLGARIVEIPPDACNAVCALRDEGPLELRPFVFWAMKKGVLFKRETRPDLRGRIERSWIVGTSRFNRPAAST